MQIPKIKNMLNASDLESEWYKVSNREKPHGIGSRAPAQITKIQTVKSLV